MDQGEPAKAPAKNPGRWQHAKNQRHRQQPKLPPKATKQGPTEKNEAGNQGNRRNKTGGEFRSRVRHETRRKIRPIDRPVWENEPRQGRERDAPLKMLRAVLNGPGGPLDVIEECEPCRRRKGQAENDPPEQRENRLELSSSA